MKNVTNVEKNSVNSPNSKANFWANLATNLKTLFTLPKGFKIFLIALSVVAVVGVIGSFALMSWASDKVETANLTFNGIDKGNKKVKANENAYSARVHFERLDVLLRSKVIAYIDIKNISWAQGIETDKLSSLKSQNRYIKFISTQNLQDLNIQNLGEVKFTMDFSPLLKTIVWYYVWIVVFVLSGLCFWNSLTIYPWQAKPASINPKDCIFLGFAFLLCIGICIFTFWLGFPGYNHIIDIAIALSLDKSNWHPVFTPYVLEFLYFLFGKHTYYLFLFNIIPFYLGLFLLIASFYLHSKNPLAIWLIFPTFLGEIYFSNFVAFSNSAIAMLLFCLYSLLLFLILVPLDKSPFQKILSKILWIFLFVLMFVTILWRHNAIFSVFPVFFVLCYILLKHKNLSFKAFASSYIVLLLLSAVLCLSIVIGVPKVLTKKVSYPANLIFLHQIAGACVLSNDSSCFKEEWYKEGKNFKDVKIAYQKEPLVADYLVWHSGIFNDQNITKTELQNAWINSIFKYPLNYTKHQIQMIKAMWIQKGGVAMFNANDMQHTLDNGMGADGAIEIIKDNAFPLNEQNITFTQQRQKIYTFLFSIKFPALNCIISVSVAFILMIVCGILLSVRKFRVQFYNNTLLLFIFSASFASFWSAVFIAVFTGNPGSRYMSPILPLSLIALVGFVAFVFDYSSLKRIKAEKD